jgi:peptide/nickel transport system permease protein
MLGHVQLPRISAEDLGGVVIGSVRASPITNRQVKMLRYILRRLVFSIPVLLLSSILVFAVIRANGDFLSSSIGNPRTDRASQEKTKEALGLNRSGYQQYVGWITHFVRGEWGRSFLTNRPVVKDMRDALWNTMVLGLIATLFSLLIGVAIGMYSSLRQYSLFDHVATGGAFFGLSIPPFWFALMLQVFFGIYLVRWFHLNDPIFYITGMFKAGTTGFDLADRFRHIVLPMLVLAVQEIAIFSRFFRASMLEVLQADYMRTARAKGLPERRVIFHHATRNALIPLTTLLALSIGSLAGGLIITEQVFQWPGMGKMFIDAFSTGDYPVILPWVMVTVAFVIVFNLVADIAYAFLDPRIRYT